MGLICDCPLAESLPDVPLNDCPDSFGQIQKVIFQRLENALGVKNNITDIYACLKPAIDEYNKTAVAYKKIGILKIRDTEFPKNTLRKIMRFKLDMSID